MIPRKKWARLGISFLLYGIPAQVAAVSATWSEWWVHGAWCVGGFLLAFPIIVRAVRRGAQLVIQDHLVMFTAAFAVYFVVGAALLAFGSADSIERALSYYQINASGALRADAVNAFGFGTAILAAAYSPHSWFERRVLEIGRACARLPPRLILLGFLTVSLIANATVTISDISSESAVVAGSWRVLTQLSLVSVFLGISYRGRGRRLVWLLATAVMAFEVVSGLLLLNKSKALLPIMAYVGGLSLRCRPRVVVPVGVAVIASFYVGIGGVVSFGRKATISSGWVSLEDRVQVLGDGVQSAAEDDPSADYYGWNRISYTVPQVAALEFYDSGRGGKDFQMIPWLFLPRALFPRKPIITQTGRDFHEKISGREGSSTGQGIFSSGYYNGGWFGLFVASALCGWILAQTSAIARAVLRQNALLLFPLALFGVKIAFRIDAVFLADWCGSFVIIAYAVVVGALLVRLTRLGRGARHEA